MTTISTRFVLPVPSVGEGITPFDGAKLYFYEPETSTLVDTYSTPDLDPNYKNTNPVIADEFGFFPDIWYGQTVRAVLKDKNDVQWYDWDPVYGFIETPTEQVNYYKWSDIVTSQSVGSGTSVTVTGIDSSNKRVEVFLANIQLSNTDGLAIRVGNGSIISTAAYSGGSTSDAVSASSTEVIDWTYGALGSLTAATYAGIINARPAGSVRAHIVLTNINDDRYSIEVYAGNSTGTDEVIFYGTGRVDAGSVIDRIQILTSGTGTFTNGTISVKQYANTGTLTSSLQLDAMGEYGNQGDFYLNDGDNNDLVLVLPTPPDVEYRTTYPPLNGSTYMAGTKARYLVDADNTGAMTASLGSGPVLDVVRKDGTPAQAGDAPEGAFVTINYDYIADRWVIDNFSIPDDYITTDMIQDGAITTDKIADGAVTAAKIDPSVLSGLGSVVAWCQFDGTLTTPITPAAQKNVSTVVRNSNGHFTINFTSALADTKFGVLSNSNRTKSYSWYETPTVNGVDVKIWADNSEAFVNPTSVTVLVVNA